MGDRGAILRRFADRLEEVRLAAGNPSYAYLARASPWLKRSTVSDVLCGRSNPSLDFVVAFVERCRAHAGPRSLGLDGDLFDVDGWRGAWLELQREIGAVRRSRRSSPAGSGPDTRGERSGPPPSQLPPGPYPFVGRDVYLEALNAILPVRSAPADARASAVAVDGPAGVGKTALVIHWARQVRAHHRDGELYLDLRGYGPGGPPVTPVEAVRALLEALRVPAAGIPRGFDQMTTLWRSLLAQRQLLVVLDNARSAGQVRPLLPGAGLSTVVITSRRRLNGLLVRDGVAGFSLAPMTAAESRSLMRAAIGPELVVAEPAAADDLATFCGHNPLAMRILADRVAGRPRPLSQVVRELGHRHPLEVLSTADGDQTTAIRAVLGWSYQALPEAAARMFRLLALHPGPHLSVGAAAALAGTDPDPSAGDLQELVDVYLLSEVGRSGYRMHDLVRHLSAELLDVRDHPGEQADAQRREVLWYLHSAAAADRILMPGRRDLVEGPAPDDVRPAAFADYEQALAWCDAERANIVSVVRLAAERRWYDLCWRLATILLSYFNLRKAWTEWITCFDLALAAARELRDGYAEATCLNALGIARRELGDHDAALRHFSAAVTAFHAIGDAEGESYALNNIGTTYQSIDQYLAERALRQALDVARSGGSRTAELVALHNLGESYLSIHRYTSALACAFECLDIYERTSDPAGVGFALTSLGEVYARLHRWSDAVRYLGAAIAVRSELGDIQGEAVAHLRLGRAYAARGDRGAAHDHLRRACAILDDLGDPLAADVRVALRRL